MNKKYFPQYRHCRRFGDATTRGLAAPPAVNGKRMARNVRAKAGKGGEELLLAELIERLKPEIAAEKDRLRQEGKLWPLPRRLHSATGLRLPRLWGFAPRAWYRSRIFYDWFTSLSRCPSKMRGKEVPTVRILIAEDEREIGKVLKALLERNKYSVDWVTNGEDACDYIMTGNYDAVILDIMMPGRDGVAVLREIRARGCTVPVLFLTARSGLADRIEGLDAGADDYLPKPFASTELLARVRAMLRRRSSYLPELLTLGDLTLNCSAFELSANGKSVRLNNKEFQIMELFMRSPRSLFSTEQLMTRIWGWDTDSEVNVVWTNIAYLRRKLHELGSLVEIRSVRGAGYVLEAPPC